MTDSAAVARSHITCHHSDAIGAVAAAATRASADWPTEGVERGAHVRAAFREELAAAGLSRGLVSMLEGAVDSVGASLDTDPVPAPPYVVVTSLGVTLRATLPTGRLVVELRAFEFRGGHYRPREDVAVRVRLV